MDMKLSTLGEKMEAVFLEKQLLYPFINLKTGSFGVYASKEGLICSYSNQPIYVCPIGMILLGDTVTTGRQKGYDDFLKERFPEITRDYYTGFYTGVDSNVERSDTYSKEYLKGLKDGEIFREKYVTI